MSTKITHRSSKSDMLQYAADELGVKLDENKDRSEIWAEIKEIDASLAEATESVPAGESHVPETTDNNERPKRVLISLHQPPGSDDPEFEPDTHVVVGVNGVNYQLAINKEIPVPYAVYDVLRNAKQKKYYRVKDQQSGDMVTKCKEVLRHPFSVIRNVA